MGKKKPRTRRKELIENSTIGDYSQGDEEEEVEKAAKIRNQRDKALCQHIYGHDMPGLLGITRRNNNAGKERSVKIGNPGRKAINISLTQSDTTTSHMRRKRGKKPKRGATSAKPGRESVHTSISHRVPVGPTDDISSPSATVFRRLPMLACFLAQPEFGTGSLRLTLPWSSVPNESNPRRSSRKMTLSGNGAKSTAERVTLPAHKRVYGHVFMELMDDMETFGNHAHGLSYSVRVFPNAYALRQVRRSSSQNYPPWTGAVPTWTWPTISAAYELLYRDLPIECPVGQATHDPQIEFRLLILLPRHIGDALEGDALMGDMYCTTLESRPQYVALSYVWGENPLIESPDTLVCMRSILIRGYSVPVTENLYQALVHLRREYEPVFLWADALCIDQTNVPERNFQVRQMPKIYSAAEKVIAWLGQSTFESECAIKLIRAAPERLPSSSRVEDLRCLQELFSRAYWRRVWVVQELAAAQRSKRACEIHCGQDIITLEQLQIFLRKLLRQIQIRDFSIMMKPRTVLSLSALDPNRTFLQVLWESASLQATRACDRIYGIRGISPRFYRDNIEVDYSESMTFQLLSTKVTTLIINKERRLDILCFFQWFNGAPSWLPDFRKRCVGLQSDMYSADGGSRARARIVGSTLRVRGVNIGRVQDFKAWNNNVGDLAAIETFAADTLKKTQSDYTDLWSGNRFAEMVVGGREELSEPSTKQREHWMDARRRAREYDIVHKAFTRGKEDATTINVFKRLIGRSVFATSKGNLGLGPKEMKIGDVVCVLYGCSLPVILRKDGRYYKFVGAAYVDSAMNGEFVREVEKADRFWIR